jgi:hypothetical protein
MPDTKMTGIVAVGIGSLFVYAGIRGFSILKAAQNVIRGSPPQSGQSASLLTTTPAQSSTGPAPGIGGHSGAWSHGALMQLWIMNGGNPSAANNAACHAIQESSGNPVVTSSNPDGGTNVGLWQLDTKGKGAGYTIGQLQDPNTNARITIRATGNGRDWSAWATPGC